MKSTNTKQFIYTKVNRKLAMYNREHKSTYITKKGIH